MRFCVPEETLLSSGRVGVAWWGSDSEAPPPWVSMVIVVFMGTVCMATMVTVVAMGSIVTKVSMSDTGTT